MRSGSQIYVRRTHEKQWTTGTVLKLGPKNLYKVENSDDTKHQIVQLCPKSEIKPLTIQLSEAYKQGTPVMYYDHEKERWMHGSLLGQAVAIAKVRIYSRRARGEVSLWFEEDSIRETYPVDQTGLSSSEDLKTLVGDSKGEFKYNELYEGRDDDEEGDHSGGSSHNTVPLLRSRTTVGPPPQQLKGRNVMQPSASWSHYNQQEGTVTSLTHPFLSTPFTLPPQTSAPNAYQLNSNLNKAHARKEHSGRGGQRGIPAHPQSHFYRDPLTAANWHKQSTGHTLYHQPLPSEAKNNQFPNFNRYQSFEGGSVPMMMNPMMMNSMMVNQMMMNPMMMNPMMNPMMMNAMMMMNPMMASMMMQPSFGYNPALKVPMSTLQRMRGWGRAPPPKNPHPRPHPRHSQPERESPHYEEIEGGMTHVPSTTVVSSRTRKSSQSRQTDHLLSISESSGESENGHNRTKPLGRPLSGRRYRSRPGSAEKRSKHIFSEQKLEDLQMEEVLGSAPEILSCSSEDITTTVGKPVQMSCMAKGDPPPAITWRRNGQLIQNDGSHYYIPAPGFLYISSVVESDSGFYTCSVINDFGSVSRCFYLNVQPDATEQSNPDKEADFLDLRKEDFLPSIGSLSSSEKVTSEELGHASPEAGQTSPKKEIDLKPAGQVSSIVPKSKSVPFELKTLETDEDTSGVGTITSAASEPNAASLERNKLLLHRRDSLTTYLYGTDYGSGSIPNLDVNEDVGDDLKSKSAPKVTFPLQTQLTPVKETNELESASRTSFGVPPPGIVVTDEDGQRRITFVEVISNGIDVDPEEEPVDKVNEEPITSNSQKSKTSREIFSKIFRKLSPKRGQSKPTPNTAPPPPAEVSAL